MHLTPSKIEVITQTVSHLTRETSEVFLLGSRLDDQARGGDVDLLIETYTPLTLLKHNQLKMELESLVYLLIDIALQARYIIPTPFTDYAEIAEHLNLLHTLILKPHGDVIRFLDYCQANFGIFPLPIYFAAELTAIARDHPKQVYPRKLEGYDKIP